MDNYKKPTFAYQIQPASDDQNTNIIKLKYCPINKRFIKDYSKLQNHFQQLTSDKTNENNSDFEGQNEQLIDNVQSIISQNHNSQNLSFSEIYRKQSISEKSQKKDQTISIENKIQNTIENSFKFNKKILKKRKKICQHMKKIENQVKTERSNFRSSDLIQNNISLYITENDKSYYDSNGSFKVGKTNIENFIKQNIMQEQQVNFQNQVNQNNHYGYSKRFQRRKRRKRNAFGILEDRLPVE